MKSNMSTQLVYRLNSGLIALSRSL